jgi:hypothetical protein
MWYTGKNENLSGRERFSELGGRCWHAYGGGLIQHSIGKCTTPTNGVLTDSYYPNQIVDHLNTTTAHMEVFGDPLVVYCQWYFPFHY